MKSKNIISILIVSIIIVILLITAFVIWRNEKVQAANELKNECMTKAVFNATEYSIENKDISDANLKYRYQFVYNLCLLDKGVKETDLSKWKPKGME